MTTPTAPAPAAPPLRQLVYASTAAIGTRAALDDILRVARRRNREHGVTGLLLHAPDRFMQYLEGPPAAVAEIFELITTDPRHHSVAVLADGPIEQRSFADWAMAAAEVDTMAWLHLTLAAWPAPAGAEPGAGAVRVDAPSGLKLLEEFRAGQPPERLDAPPADAR